MIKVRPRVKKVDFEFYAPDAHSVSVLGDFSGWQPVPMKKGRKGMWKLTLDLAPGRYEFRYLVDGHYWVNDESTPTVPNIFGSENSVFEVPEKETRKSVPRKPRARTAAKKTTTKAKAAEEAKPKRKRGRPRKKAE